MVKVGDQFRAVYADGNCLWQVEKQLGRGVWRCFIVNEKVVIDGKTYDGDYAGVVKSFMTKEIEASKRMLEDAKQRANEHESYYASLKEGEIVHYDNGFNQFVRCRVTANHELLPIALVGNWHSHDLPSRSQTGEIYYPYHAKGIVEGNVMTPHFSNIYEARIQKGIKLIRKDTVDPRTLEPINLEVPKPTSEAAENARLWRLIAQIEAEIDHNANPRKVLDKIAELVQQR